MDWEEHLGKINELVREQNQHQQKYGMTQDIRILSLKWVLEIYWVHYFGG